MSKETKFKTVKKWQEEFNVGLKYNLRGDLLQQYDVNFARSESHILKVSMVTATLGFEKSESASHKKAAN